MLARREYARAELEHRLIARGAKPDEVRLLLAQLVEEGYLSDARYAEAALARGRASFGCRRIVDALKAKGVTAGSIEAALKQAPLDDEATLRALWERRFGHAPADPRDKARQVRFLQARGFALSSILRLLSKPPG